MSFELIGKIYPYLKPYIFSLDAEKAHKLTLNLLKIIPKSLICKYKPTKSFECMGLNFKNRIGLAAGLDKNAEYLKALSKLDFAFIEIGTLTPKPQAGNPKPRLFRYTKEQALVNRMGFNNVGVEKAIINIQNSGYKGILGINIGKNKDTPLDKAYLDYVFCIDKIYKYASYITINISSPNTLELRSLQQAEYLQELLKEIMQARKKAEDETQKRVPLVIKISPDEMDDNLKTMLDLILEAKIDGIIATNTTIEKPFSIQEQGGLSGLPLHTKSTKTIKFIKKHVGSNLNIIASGGIMNASFALEKIAAGANLIQLYTGLIYEGPKLISEINEAFNSSLL